jgi:methylmalonyl-CoA mutase C-terminal domain/subunit
MDHEVDALHDRLQEGKVGEIADDHFIGLPPLTVEEPQFHAGLLQALGEDASDTALRTGNEDHGHGTSLTPLGGRRFSHVRMLFRREISQEACAVGKGTDPARVGRPVRVLVAKVGLDGHDRGAGVVARALRDGGMEVVYGGLHLTPEQVARIAVDEDVDVIGVSILSGAHLTLIPILTAALGDLGASDVAIVCGGVIPDEDIPRLIDAGVSAIVDQEATLHEVVAVVRQAADLVRARPSQ